MDTYQVGREVFSFVAVSIDAPLWACELKEQDLLSVSLAIIQRLEQDAHVMTMIDSFLDSSGATFSHLAMLEEGASEGTCRLVGTLLELEHSRGWAVGHLLSGVITRDCNMKLLRQQSLLPSLT